MQWSMVTFVWCAFSSHRAFAFSGNHLWMAERGWARTSSLPQQQQQHQQLQLSRRTNRRCLHGKKSNQDDEDASFDAEAARQKLEHLLFPEKGNLSESRGDDEDAGVVCTVEDLIKIGTSVQEKSTNLDDDDDDKTSSRTLKDDLARIAPLPPLTSADRERRTAEILLLEGLARQDDPVTRSLWTLWYSEGGARAKQDLDRADQLMVMSGGGGQWKDCESVLTHLIEQHGPYFAEPINRLATLYYLQQRHTDSLALCRVVLAVKPWHFGALSGLVQIYTLQRDREQARYWANRRLPTLAAHTSAAPFAGGVTNPRRREWVERAVQQARNALETAEERTLSETLGQPEDYYRRPPRTDTSSTGYDDWQ